MLHSYRVYTYMKQMIQLSIFTSTEKKENSILSYTDQYYRFILIPIWK